jgi:hypothetical protein
LHHHGELDNPCPSIGVESQALVPEASQSVFNLQIARSG